MLSTSELLACHHDAKLPPASAGREREATQVRSACNRQAPFRPGLRVTIGLDGGEERPAFARWTEGHGADIVVTEDA
jgi:hypothetical protein